MKSIRQTKKELDALAEKHRIEQALSENAVINMTVKNDDGFLSVFSESDTPVISSEVASFLENSARTLPSKKRITLKIYSDCVDEREKVAYQNAVKEYYTEKYIANDGELKRNNLSALMLALSGILVLALAILLDARLNVALWSEAIDIVAWVLLWEAVDIKAFKNKELRVNKWLYLSFVSMKIEYHDLKKQK